MSTATTTASRPTTMCAPHEIAREWREGLLQDLVAVSIIVRTLKAHHITNGDALPLLDAASAALDIDLELVRAALEREVMPKK